MCMCIQACGDHKDAYGSGYESTGSLHIGGCMHYVYVGLGGHMKSMSITEGLNLTLALTLATSLTHKDHGNHKDTLARIVRDEEVAVTNLSEGEGEGEGVGEAG